MSFTPCNTGYPLHSLAREDTLFELRLLGNASREGETMLTEREREQLAPLRGVRRVEWLATRAVVKRLAWKVSPGVSPRLVETCREADRQPCCVLPDGREFAVSVSHDRRYVLGVLAKTGRRAGVDLEKVDPRAERVIRRFVPGWPRESLAATSLYCACEAVAKCSGVPLAGVLRSSVPRQEPSTIRLDLPGAGRFTVRQMVFDRRVVSFTTA